MQVTETSTLARPDIPTCRRGVTIRELGAAREGGLRRRRARLLRTIPASCWCSRRRFRRGKGDKTLDVALQPETRAALSDYLEGGRPLLVEHALAAGEADPDWLFVSACQSD
jgi:integrase